jgi:hypothetical protein
VKFFHSYFSMNILHVFLTSSIYHVIELTAFKPTHYMLELWRVMRHWDRFFVRRRGFALVSFLSNTFAHRQTDRQTDTSCGDGKCGHKKRDFILTLILVCVSFSLFVLHVYIILHCVTCLIRLALCYLFISSCTNFFDHCNKIAGEW